MNDLEFYLLLLVVLTILTCTLMLCNWWLDGKVKSSDED